jgi:ElaA protein
VKTFDFKIAHWGDLSKEQLYAILRLRQEVFVFEQYCPYVDCDNLDVIATHIWAEVDGELVAYIRNIPPNTQYEEASFGRVIVDRRYRSTGLGKKIVYLGLQQMKEEYGYVPVRIMAQHYLLKFYSSFGFKALPAKVWEDDILHFYMLKAPESLK